MSEEARQALEGADAGSECLRFPLSAGEAREDVDHQGQACSVTDCIFNLDVIKQAEGSRWALRATAVCTQVHADVQAIHENRNPQAKPVPNRHLGRKSIVP